MKIKPNGNILFVSHDGDFKGGAEISGLELIKSAQRRGYNVTTIVPKKSEFYNQLQKNNLAAHVLDYGWHVPETTALEALKTKQNIQSSVEISKLIKENDIDCVISNSTVVPWGAFAAALTNVPHIWICREFPEDDLSYISEYYDFIDSFSNKIMANSQNVANYIKDTFQLKRVGFFYSYVDSTHLTLGPSTGETRIIQVGNISSRKNQLDLILAYGSLKKEDRHNKIVFIGHIVEDSYYQLLLQKIRELHLEDTVIFMPFTENPWLLITSDDIFVQTSSSESIGRTTTEAMKLGIICVGSSIPGVKEAFDLGGGYIYEHGNPSDLSKQLSKILSNIDFYRQKAKEFQKNALDNMSEEACHAPLFEQLELVLSEKNHQKQLRHLYPYFEAQNEIISELRTNLKDERSKSSKLINERSMLYKRIDEIYDSKAWKLVQKAKKIFRK